MSRAHFYADAVRDVYVRLPDEDPKAKLPAVCGKLRKTMYGSLDAAQRLGEHYAQVLETAGFSRSVASPCHFFHKDLDTYILVHGDDFFIVGRQEGRKHALCLLRGAYELSKVVTLGPESSQSQTASFLGRTLTLRQWRIEYEPDQQHVSRALKALGLANAKGVATPGTDDVGGSKASEISELRRTAKWHDPPEEIKEEDYLLTGEELKLFQSVAARFNFLAMDRPDLLCGEWLHHAPKTLPPSRELLDTRSNTREWLADMHGPSWTPILRYSVTQILLDATPRENPRWEEWRCGVASL